MAHFAPLEALNAKNKMLEVSLDTLIANVSVEPVNSQWNIAKLVVNPDDPPNHQHECEWWSVEQACDSIDKKCLRHDGKLFGAADWGLTFMDNEGTHGTRSGGFTPKIREDEQSEEHIFLSAQTAWNQERRMKPGSLHPIS